MVSRLMKARLGTSSPIREAYELAERLKGEYGTAAVYDFSIGNPTAPCPDGVGQALARSLEISTPASHGYMQSSGYGEVRQLVAESLNSRFGASYTMDDIVMTAGAACALNVIMQATLDPGDEVVAFAPYYAAYPVFAENCGARFVGVQFDPKTFLPDLAAFASALTRSTRMVLVNTPNNPSGLVYPQETARGIADTLREHCRRTGRDVLLVSDEPYRELVFDGAGNPWWPELYDNTAVVYSWSKSASIAGERIGYVALPPSVPEGDLLHRGVCRALGDLGFVNAPATAQRMAAACVDDVVDVGYYDGNRRALYDGLVACGFSPLRSNGAFYMLLPAPDGDEGLLLERLAMRRIVAVGGSAFGCPGHVRLSYCVPPGVIEGAIPGFAQVSQLYSEAEGVA